MKNTMIYATYRCDYMTITALFKNSEEKNRYLELLKEDGYAVNRVCELPLMVSGSNRKERKESFLAWLDKFMNNDTGDLTYTEEDTIRRWIYENARALHVVRVVESLYWERSIAC